MSHPIVAILMGSDSDLEMMKEAADVLDEFGISYEVKILSAHRSPKLVSQYALKAQKSGLKVFICGAGGAAHLAGVVAAHTVLPVIGVPIPAAPLNGMDSLLATVQMPSGIPVATVAVGKSGARNAGILAVQMLAIESPQLKDKLVEFKKSLADSVRKKNQKLKDRLAN